MSDPLIDLIDGIPDPDVTETIELVEELDRVKEENRSLRLEILVLRMAIER